MTSMAWGSSRSPSGVGEVETISPGPAKATWEAGATAATHGSHHEVLLLRRPEWALFLYLWAV